MGFGAFIFGSLFLENVCAERSVGSDTSKERDTVPVYRLGAIQFYAASANEYNRGQLL